LRLRLRVAVDENLPVPRRELIETVLPVYDPRMSTPVLETKLHAPRTRHGLVGRRRLNDVMRRGAATKLTLDSALGDGVRSPDGARRGWLS
jgi:hypothetical protein